MAFFDLVSASRRQGVQFLCFGIRVSLLQLSPKASKAQRATDLHLQRVMSGYLGTTCGSLHDHMPNLSRSLIYTLPGPPNPSRSMFFHEGPHRAV